MAKFKSSSFVLIPLSEIKGPLISESGIKTKEDLLEITKKTKIKTFLIGESLLKNPKNNSIFSVL